jgi:hypothetical protein
MESSRGRAVWKQIGLTRRCPYCVEGFGFRPMVELSGSPEGAFFCSNCRHMVRSGEESFKCECVHCRNLRHNVADSAAS